jgi:uncharacterized protein YggE
MALITLGVVSEGKTAGEALAENSQAMTRMIDALKGEGIESRDLQTANFSVEPVYSQPPDQPRAEPFQPEIVGYRVRNDLMLRVRDLARVGALLDRSVTLGANSVSGPIFSVDDPAPLEDQARRAAMRDAIGRGELFADAAGVPLGPIYRIEERTGQFQQPIPMGAMAREMAADSAVPIEGGELTFRAEVAVSWKLAD